MAFIVAILNLFAKNFAKLQIIWNITKKNHEKIAKITF